MTRPSFTRKPSPQKPHVVLTVEQKRIVVETINEYGPLGVPDLRIKEIAEARVGKKLHRTTFAKAKKVAMNKNLMAKEWIDRYIRHDMVAHFRRRMEELETAQRHVIKRFLVEAEKGDDADPETIARLSSCIKENAKLMCEIGFAPPVLARIQQLYPPEQQELPSINLRRWKHNMIDIEQDDSLVPPEVSASTQPGESNNNSEDPQRVF